MRFSIRWVFAVAVVVCGIVVLIKANSSTPEIATGLGLILGGVGLVVP